MFYERFVAACGRPRKGASGGDGGERHGKGKIVEGLLLCGFRYAFRFRNCSAKYHTRPRTRSIRMQQRPKPFQVKPESSRTGGSRTPHEVGNTLSGHKISGTATLRSTQSILYAYSTCCCPRRNPTFNIVRDGRRSGQSTTNKYIPNITL